MACTDLAIADDVTPILELPLVVAANSFFSWENGVTFAGDTLTLIFPLTPPLLSVPQATINGTRAKNIQ
jgi:hypothetical protein